MSRRFFLLFALAGLIATTSISVANAVDASAWYVEAFYTQENCPDASFVYSSTWGNDSCTGDGSGGSYSFICNSLNVGISQWDSTPICSGPPTTPATLEGDPTINICGTYAAGLWLKRWCISDAPEDVLLFLANSTTPGRAYTLYDYKVDPNGGNTTSCGNTELERSNIQLYTPEYCEPQGNEVYGTYQCNDTHITVNRCYSTDCLTGCNETISYDYTCQSYGTSTWWKGRCSLLIPGVAPVRAPVSAPVAAPTSTASPVSAPSRQILIGISVIGGATLNDTNAIKQAIVNSIVGVNAADVSVELIETTKKRVTYQAIVTITGSSVAAVDTAFNANNASATISIITGAISEIPGVSGTTQISVVGVAPTVAVPVAASPVGSPRGAPKAAPIPSAGVQAPRTSSSSEISLSIFTLMVCISFALF